MATITRHAVIKIFQAVKFAIIYEKIFFFLVVAKLPKVWNFQKIELGSFNDFETYLILFNKKTEVLFWQVYIY